MWRIKTLLQVLSHIYQHQISAPTIMAMIVGAILAIVFDAANAYLGLIVGMTVSVFRLLSNERSINLKTLQSEWTRYLHC